MGFPKVVFKVVEVKNCPLYSFDDIFTLTGITIFISSAEENTFVNTTIYRPETLPVHLDFRMKRDGDNWRIIDVKANGSSAVLYYRRHFIAELRAFQRQGRPF